MKKSQKHAWLAQQNDFGPTFFRSLIKAGTKGHESCAPANEKSAIRI
jgi:hypothetical protein